MSWLYEGIAMMRSPEVAGAMIADLADTMMGVDFEDSRMDVCWRPPLDAQHSEGDH